jgi:glycosyltransferase involved in cell wall biosynthesis
MFMSRRQNNPLGICAKKKFLFVIHGLPMGGAEKFLIGLLNHFVQLGYHPVLILLSHDLTLLNELDNTIEVKIVTKKNKFDLSFPFRVKNVIRLANPDLIVCINPYSFFIARIPFLLNRSYRFCLSPHSTIPFSFKNYLQNYLYMLSVRAQDMVICLCAKQKEFLTTNYPLSSRHILVINNGIDFNHFKPDREFNEQIAFWKGYCSIKENEKTVLLAARITEEKRHIDAIEVVAKMNQKNVQKCHLLIVGDGPISLVNSLKKQASNLKQDEFIHFLGAKQDVRPFYAMADLFVLTSFSETFSIAVIESLSFGVPVAITDVGGASEMVIDGFNGLLTTPKDIDGMAHKWHLALNRNYNHAEIIQSARNKFDLPVMLRKYEKAFFEYSPSFQN